MFQNIFLSILLISVSTINAFVEDPSKVYTVTCRTDFCKEALESCIAKNCYGARGCKSLIELFYPACTRCVDDILDQNNYELVNGNYHLVCDSNDDLQVKACLYYCRVYYYPSGQCVRQNNIPICRCLDEDTNLSTPITTTSLPTSSTSTYITITSTTTRLTTTTDIGCNAGGSFSCLSGGICLANGTCQYPQSNWLNASTVLSSTEQTNLYSMIYAPTGLLLYKATRDGFTVKAFHDRCDNVPNTVTIIRNSLNFVFGGFTSARWSSTLGSISDSNAFIFSLRRSGTSNNNKIMIKTSESSNAIYGLSSYGPTFGGGRDIYIGDNSSTTPGSYSAIATYTAPTYPSGSDSTTFLTGGFGNWLTTEIEVIQLSSSDSDWLSSSSSNFSLSTAEKNYLYLMTQPFKYGTLLYRASRDGFTTKAFHDRCDNVPNTVTIIRNNLDFVFGGFTSARWSSTAGSAIDPSAFIFSLRRSGTSNNYKLMIKSSTGTYAIYGGSTYGPTFGEGHDIYMLNNSNALTGSHSAITTYTAPTYPSGSVYTTFLTGGYQNWLTTEIEVYQIFQ